MIKANNKQNLLYNTFTLYSNIKDLNQTRVT